MKTTLRSKFLTAALSGLAGLLLSASASFAQIFQVNINTTALTLPVNALSAPFALDFQLNSGNTLNNNTAVISNFTFGGGGAPFGSATAIGGASGSLPGIITLSDTFAFNEFFQSFTAGSFLSFKVSLTQNADAGPTPDGFSISLLDNALFNISTTGFADQLLSVDFPGSISSIQTFTGTGNFSGITLSITPVPEPSTYGVIAGVAVLMVALAKRGRRALKHPVA